MRDIPRLCTLRLVYDLTNEMVEDASWEAKASVVYRTFPPQHASAAAALFAVATSMLRQRSSVGVAALVRRTSTRSSQLECPRLRLVYLAPGDVYGVLVVPAADVVVGSDLVHL